MIFKWSTLWNVIWFVWNERRWPGAPWCNMRSEHWYYSECKHWASSWCCCLSHVHPNTQYSRDTTRNRPSGKRPAPTIYPTFIFSPSISTAFSLKSTPMVASVLQGKAPPVKRKVKQVLPTFESPMTMILKIRVCTLWSRDVLRSRDDVMFAWRELAVLSLFSGNSFAITVKWCTEPGVHWSGGDDGGWDGGRDGRYTPFADAVSLHRLTDTSWCSNLNAIKIV